MSTDTERMTIQKEHKDGYGYISEVSFFFFFNFSIFFLTGLIT